MDEPQVNPPEGPSPSAQPPSGYGMSEPTEAQDYKNLQDRRHSGPGIASFVIGLVTVVGYIAALAAAGAIIAPLIDEIGELRSDSSEAFILLGMSVLGLAALNLIGVITGIIGIALRDRKKALAVIGTLINGLILLLFILVIAVGLANVGAS
ncbi:hypothetical protein F4V43_15195 [Paenibacillus spiritus]|uniref:Uncharacterized protein n=1 Tax=Paenibacillus spiritus TaxID=2496557 RepID=A0A5J5G036_9BACL|nr:hypothetical protein [Paenibacillus spiritus]KAA8999674.1 hypothetical protein F4V43_15195 [Paenibacillus spiritus]